MRCILCDEITQLLIVLADNKFTNHSLLGKPINLQKRMEENANLDALHVAEEGLCAPTSSAFLFRAVVLWTSHQFVRPALQQKDRRFAVNSKRLQMGLDSDLW